MDRAWSVQDFRFEFELQALLDASLNLARSMAYMISVLGSPTPPPPPNGIPPPPPPSPSRICVTVHTFST